MTVGMWLYLVSIVYLGVIIGLSIRLIDQKAPATIILAPVIPILVFIFNFKIALDSLFKSKKKLHNKLRNFVTIIIFGVTEFNILTGFTCNFIAKSSIDRGLKSIFRSMIRFATGNKVTFNKGYKDFFQNNMIKNTRHAI